MMLLFTAKAILAKRKQRKMVLMEGILYHHQAATLSYSTLTHYLAQHFMKLFTLSPYIKTKSKRVNEIYRYTFMEACRVS